MEIHILFSYFDVIHIPCLYLEGEWIPCKKMVGEETKLVVFFWTKSYPVYFKTKNKTIWDPNPSLIYFRFKDPDMTIKMAELFCYKKKNDGWALLIISPIANICHN